MISELYQALKEQQQNEEREYQEYLENN